MQISGFAKESPARTVCRTLSTERLAARLVSAYEATTPNRCGCLGEIRLILSSVRILRLQGALVVHREVIAVLMRSPHYIRPLIDTLCQQLSILERLSFVCIGEEEDSIKIIGIILGLFENLEKKFSKN